VMILGGQSQSVDGNDGLVLGASEEDTSGTEAT
jgi:hypothetical protein